MVLPCYVMYAYAHTFDPVICKSLNRFRRTDSNEVVITLDFIHTSEHATLELNQ